MELMDAEPKKIIFKLFWFKKFLTKIFIKKPLKLIFFLLKFKLNFKQNNKSIDLVPG